MAKTKTSKKRKQPLKVTLKPFKIDRKLLADRKLIAEILVDALLQNDMDTFRDVVIAHLRTVSKTYLSKSTGLGRRTLYDLMDGEKFDPKVSTLAALLSKIAA